jgi:calmodulin
MGNGCFQYRTQPEVRPAASNMEDVHIAEDEAGEGEGAIQEQAVTSFEMDEREEDPSLLASNDAAPALENDDDHTNSMSSNTVWKLTKQQEDDCEHIFSVFEDEDDMVDLQHLGPMMRAVNFNCEPTDEEITSITERFQTNNGQTNKFDFQQFVKLMAPRIIQANEVYSEEQITLAFNTYDADRSGYISASELRLALRNGFCSSMQRVAEELTDDDVEEVMAEADLNGDGKISFSEFKKMIPILSANIHTPRKIK